MRQGGVGELIHAMVELAEDQQIPLRVVLAGQQADKLEYPGARLVEDDAVGLARGDVEQWLVDRAKEEGRMLPAARLAAELARLFPDATLPKPGWLDPAAGDPARTARRGPNGS